MNVVYEMVQVLLMVLVIVMEMYLIVQALAVELMIVLQIIGTTLEKVVMLYLVEIQYHGMQLVS